MSAARGYCTPNEKQALAEDQNGLCACGCGEVVATKEDKPNAKWVFRKGAEFDHSTMNAWIAGKPDQILWKPCHRKKTNIDLGKNAKVNRIAGKTRSQWNGTNAHRGKIRGNPSIASRPFGR